MRRVKQTVNSNNTMGFDRKTSHVERKNNMRASIAQAKKDLMTGNTDHIYFHVLVPEKPKYYVENMEDPEEKGEVYDWWAENLVDFLTELHVLYVSLTKENEEWLEICSRAKNGNLGLGYPDGVQYQWKVSQDSPPEVIPVHNYVENVLSWSAEQVDNEDVFPSDEDAVFPADYPKHVRKMYSRLFRVYYIIFSNKCLHITNEGKSNSLRLCFRHFLFFGWKWNLLPEHELKSMEHILGPLRRTFLDQEKAYKAQKLPYPGGF